MNKENRIYIIVLFLLCFVYFLAGCSVIESLKPEPTNVLHPEWLSNFLENPTCHIPCWENITPGVTNLDEVKHVLSVFPDIAEIHGQEEFVVNKIAWDFTGENKSWGGIDFNENNIVKHISFSISYLKPSLTIGEIVNQYGEPTHVVIGPCIGEWFSDWCPIELIYLDSGMSLGYTIEKHSGWHSINISPNIEINSIELYSPGEEGYLEMYPASNYPEKVEWHGYRKYENPMKE